MAAGRGTLISGVAPGSLADEIGLRPGDRLVALNSHPITDLIDYLRATEEDFLSLEVERADGELVTFEIEKDPEDGLGLEFPAAVFDGVRRCRNRCVFCFVDQLPEGLRPSLYVKDDDYRLSFCQGNYITLTNLSPLDVERIVALRLSPLYVSLHAMEPSRRAQLLGNPKGGREGLDLFRSLVRRGIEVHVQLVLCPGWNDGLILEETLKELSGLGEGIRSVAAVPVGLTRFRPESAGVRAFSGAEAKGVLAIIHRWQASFFAERGSRVVFAADEFYLKAGEPLPPAVGYEDFSQLEDGVGLARLFWEEASAALTAAPPGTGEECHVLTGVAGAKVLHPVLLAMERAGHEVRLIVVPNRFFGSEGITVTGLLTGGDIVEAVAAARHRGERLQRLLVPQVLFRSGGGVTLDDLSPEELAERCAVQLEVVATSGEAFVRSVCRGSEGGI